MLHCRRAIDQLVAPVHEAKKHTHQRSRLKLAAGRPRPSLCLGDVARQRKLVNPKRDCGTSGCPSDSQIDVAERLATAPARLLLLPKHDEVADTKRTTHCQKVAELVRLALPQPRSRVGLHRPSHILDEAGDIAAHVA